MWEVSWRREQTATHWPHVPLTIATLLPHCGGLLNRGSWGPKPYVWGWFSLRHLISNWNCSSNSYWPKPSVAPSYIIVWRTPASCGRTHLHQSQPRPQVKVIFRHPRPHAPVSLFFCLFTLVHLLIDGSVEGQYAIFLLGSSSVHTTIWIQQIDVNKTYAVKARWELDQNVMCCLEKKPSSNIL